MQPVNLNTGCPDPILFEEQEGGFPEAAQFLMYLYRHPPLFPCLDNWHRGYIPCPIFQPRIASFQEVPRVGRNDPCPCGSGKKHKKCCAKVVTH